MKSFDKLVIRGTIISYILSFGVQLFVTTLFILTVVLFFFWTDFFEPDPSQVKRKGTPIHSFEKQLDDNLQRHLSSPDNDAINNIKKGD